MSKKAVPVAKFLLSLVAESLDDDEKMRQMTGSSLLLSFCKLSAEDAITSDGLLFNDD